MYQSDTCDVKYAVHLSKSHGFLTSHSSRQHRHGTSDCPWIITVPPGQRIDLAILNFSSGGKYRVLSCKRICFRIFGCYKCIKCFDACNVTSAFHLVTIYNVYHLIKQPSTEGGSKTGPFYVFRQL